MVSYRKDLRAFKGFSAYSCLTRARNLLLRYAINVFERICFLCESVDSFFARC